MITFLSSVYNIFLLKLLSDPFQKLESVLLDVMIYLRGNIKKLLLIAVSVSDQMGFHKITFQQNQRLRIIFCFFFRINPQLIINIIILLLLFQLGMIIKLFYAGSPKFQLQHRSTISFLCSVEFYIHKGLLKLISAFITINPKRITLQGILSRIVPICQGLNNYLDLS